MVVRGAELRGRLSSARWKASASFFSVLLVFSNPLRRLAVRLPSTPEGEMDVPSLFSRFDSVAAEVRCHARDLSFP